MSASVNDTYFYNFTYDDPEISYGYDKKAFTGCFITFLVLSLVTNIFTIAAVIRLFIKQPVMRTSPKHVAIIFCCGVHLITNLLTDTFAAHFHLNREQYFSAPIFTCAEASALELGFFILLTLAHLLVVVVVMTEVLRLQQVIKMRMKMQMVAMVVLVLLAVVYVAVVLPVVFFAVTLEEKCDEDGYIVFTTDKEKARVMPGVDYLLPAICDVFSVGFLILVYINSGQRTKTSVSTPQTGPPSTAQRGSSPQVTAEGYPQGHHPYNFLTLVAPRASPSNRQFPVDVIMAVLVVLFFQFPFFFNVFLAYYLEPRPDWKERQKLWAASVLLLSLAFVLVPCCWLLDRSIRAVLCRCNHESRADDAFVTPEPISVQHGNDADINTRL